MLILSRVCAEFTDRNGAVIHRITPAMTGLFHDAPEAIRGSLLFQMLVEDGSIKMPEDARKDRNLEQDPMKGATADGREIVAASGGSDGDFEVNEISAGARGARAGTPVAVRVRNPAVRGTVATIEAADKAIAPEKEQKPVAVSKPAKGTKTVREETKPAGGKAPKA